ncbi:hypothetical protein D9757_007169 [Collybiopsis confluens]|uniref:Uncharacterized protein n=1 Tax=Collybiopsis confluens TaxID=2823264 RepID=A0A8H5M3V4_9AGAR|nr:hypothetical protein D9757_007169 [Collybiopsis confluens]
MASISKPAAVLTFSSLAFFAFQYIVGHAQKSGLFAALESQCSASSPFTQAYSGVPVLDRTLCILVSVFHETFKTANGIEFLTYFIASATPLVAHVYFEAGRRNSPFPLSLPLLFVQGFQVATFGATFAVYWLLFILTGAAEFQPAGRKTLVTMGHVLNILFGLAIGLGYLTYAMIERKDPYTTALWQVFPLIVSGASYLPVLVLPSHNVGRRESGFNVLRAFYGLAAIGLAYMHVTLLRTKTTEELKALFVPSLSVLSSSTPTELQALDLFQWDMIFGLGSSLLGTVWFARDVTEAIGLLIFNAVATLVVGPGAAFAAVALWREGRLHSDIRSGNPE